MNLGPVGEPARPQCYVADALGGVVKAQPPSAALTIMGKGPSRTVLMEGEVWGLNSLDSFAEIQWATRWFQLHPLGVLPKEERAAYVECPVPIYTLDYEPERPGSARYPLERVEAALGRGPWCSSFDYMLALALQEGFTRIFLSGIEFQQGTMRERLMEHVSLAYWVGQARGRGVQVDIAPNSLLLRFPLRYGYDFRRERAFGRLLGRSALVAGRLDDGQVAGRLWRWLAWLRAWAKRR